MFYYVITNGVYSNYTIETIMVSKNKVNINDLFLDFKVETGLGDNDLSYDKSELYKQEWSDKYNLTETINPYFNEYARTITIFIEWLMKNHDLIKIDYNETNFDLNWLD